MLADLKAELDKSIEQTAKNDDGQISPTKTRIRKTSQMNLMAGGDFIKFRERLMSNGFDKESDLDAYLSNFSNIDAELVHKKRKKNIKNLNYQTCTADEFITNQEDSATTDNDFGLENNLLSILNKRQQNSQAAADTIRLYHKEPDNKENLITIEENPEGE